MTFEGLRIDDIIHHSQRNVLKLVTVAKDINEARYTTYNYTIERSFTNYHRYRPSTVFNVFPSLILANEIHPVNQRKKKRKWIVFECPESSTTINHNDLHNLRDDFIGHSSHESLAFYSRRAPRIWPISLICKCIPRCLPRTGVNAFMTVTRWMNHHPRPCADYFLKCCLPRWVEPRFAFKLAKITM